MKLLKSDYLSELKAQIPQNKDSYMNNDIWIDSYFNLSVIDKESIDKPIELILPTEDNKFDYENIRLLYGALKDLSLSLASDERVWSYMTHITYWDYMRKRWPLEEVNEKNSKENYIKTHYFYGEKPRNRNGIARLWWIGHITYDDSLNNPFELTEFMLKQDQDLTRMIMESPTIARNKIAVKVILKSIIKLQSEIPNFNIRKFIRHAAKYFNYRGSVTLWDSLEPQDVEKAVEQMSNKWLSQNNLIATV